MYKYVCVPAHIHTNSNLECQMLVHGMNLVFFSVGSIKCRLNHTGKREQFYDEILSLLASMGSDQQ